MSKSNGRLPLGKGEYSFPFTSAPSCADRRRSGLQQSIVDLESLASSTAKQVDELYCSVDEKLAALQGTIAALKELAEHSRQLNSSFDADVDELATDISAQLDAFEQFKSQEARIGSLQSRIQAGRELIGSLSDRVDAVSERIEGWGQADREWQEKTRKRLKVVWVVTSVVVFLVLLLFIGSQYAPEGLEETTTRIASSGLGTLRDVAGAKVDVLRNPETEPQGSSLRELVNNTGHAGISPATDVLRVFDEL